ncbi:MAG: P-loop NTPase [Oligoflexia bacterium]|nr:P-loop NTPase [Oligoflexia bacterium]MBF0364062.1 P-loop NTPase [Oligoflexia bacterium]
MKLQEKILSALSKIIDPDLHRDIVSLGFIKNLQIEERGKVSFTIELTSPACPVKSMFETRARELLMAIPEIKEVAITMGSRDRTLNREVETLSKVKHVIAVASCKGGVGKSTMAATLAAEIAASGHKVGLLDADIYGPSIPTLFDLNREELRQDEQGLLIPIIHPSTQVKMISFGLLIGDTPAILRGPMVSNYIRQLLFQVDWGELDYLFIDFPPGTGDIQLTLSQAVRLTGAVIVTTRSSLSLADVSKGILMFETLKIPMLGIIENMSYFVCDQCEKQHYIFGGSDSRGIDTLTERFGLKTLAQIPLDARRSISFNDYASTPLNRQLAENLVRELGVVLASDTPLPTISFDQRQVHIQWRDQKQSYLENLQLRLACQCALCVDEMSGRPRLDPASVDPSIHAEEVFPLGHYAVAIKWSDGHTSSIYSYTFLRKISGLR